ncbi:SAP domain-containing protein [Actinoplanes sp. CA-051413]|uniref:SAP domain-containing protein n=1 Tax=Actinoplanes sp. CA-051413 TaxID=3239899 RepID=UPI003D95E954
MAATKSAKNPTAHNDTPNTPQVREGAIAKMKVAELRQKLRTHGVKDTAELKKPELVKKLIKAEVAATKKSTSTKKTSSAKKSTSAKAKSKNPTPGNDTPNTPDVSESAIAAMKVDGLRRKLRGHGVKDTAELKKPELVKKLIKAEVAATKKSTSTKKSTTAKKSTTTKSKNPTSGNDTPNTPDVSESAIAAMKVDDLRRRLRGHGVKGTGELKKPELVQRLIKVETAGARKKASKK